MSQNMEQKVIISEVVTSGSGRRRTSTPLIALQRDIESVPEADRCALVGLCFCSSWRLCQLHLRSVNSPDLPHVCKAALSGTRHSLPPS